MKMRRAAVLTPAVLCGIAGTALAQPISSALTYQGDLTTLGVPAEGAHDLRFRLYTLADGGLQVGTTQCAENVPVVNGKFTVLVDFGAPFNGEQRFLEIDVRADTGLSCANSSGFVTLLGRQPLTAAPYASYAPVAGTAATAINANNLNNLSPATYLNLANHTGTLPGSALSGSYTNTITFGNVSGTFSGGGGGLTGLNASNISSGILNDGLLSPNIARLDNTQTFTGTKSFTARPAFNSGGAPFSVVSSTLVPLLNADLLDGLDSTAFGRLATPQTWTAYNILQSPTGLGFQQGAGQLIIQILPGIASAPRGIALPDASGTFITTGNLASITAVGPGAVNSAAIADNTVSSSDILDGTVSSGDLGDNSVTAAKLASDLASLNKVTAGKMQAVTAGVGVGTTAPEAPLHVFKGSAGTVTADGNSVLVLENSTRSYLSILSPGDERGVFFGSPVNATDGGVVYNNVSTPNGLQFRTNGNTSRMALTSAGRLGLGTLAPAAPFHLMADDQLIGQFDGNNASGVWLELKNRATSGRTWSLITTGTSNSEGAGKFLVRDSTSAAVRMAIDTAGFVGIGTSSPTLPLEVRAGTTSFTVNPGSLFGAVNTAAVTLDTPGTGTIGVWDNFAVNNNLTVGGASTFISSAAFNNAGAPFTVASSTKVAGLNADLLDGLDSSQFLTASPTSFSVSGTNPAAGSITGTNLSSLLFSSGVRGIASAGSGTTYGVYGSSGSNDGTGVYGTATSATNNVVRGVLGYVTQNNGIGVMGHSTGGGGYGVLGRSDSASDGSFAIYGTATSGAKGVVGDATTNDGVWGSSGSGVGVRATTETGSIALYAERTANGNKGWFGGFGEGGWAESPTGNGMVCLTGSAAAAAMYCRNDGGGLAINADGEVQVRVLTIVGGSDLAEPFDVSDSPVAGDRAAAAPAPGMVVCIDPENPGKLILSSEAYDAKVAGIISGANGLSPGMVMKAQGVEHAHGEHAVAMTGRVWCYVDASREAIRPGDRLTTSPTPGHAMKAADPARADGAVIGKAMTPLAAGEKGLVLVLVNLQ